MFMQMRFGGFGDCSLNVDVFAYVNTQDWNEFLGIREDLQLRMMDVVADSGTGFAFPSRTLYFARDKGLDPDRSQRSEEEVQRWRAKHKLPFPEFDLEFRKTREDTLDYPPAGSSSPTPDKTQ
jgi:MscS family membrane protein